MKRALVSVSDKNNLVPFVKKLVEHDFEIVSTGGRSYSFPRNFRWTS